MKPGAGMRARASATRGRSARAIVQPFARFDAAAATIDSSSIPRSLEHHNRRPASSSSSSSSWSSLSLSSSSSSSSLGHTFLPQAIVPVSGGNTVGETRNWPRLSLSIDSLLVVGILRAAFCEEQRRRRGGGERRLVGKFVDDRSFCFFFSFFETAKVSRDEGVYCRKTRNVPAARCSSGRHLSNTSFHRSPRVDVLGRATHRIGSLGQRNKRTALANERTNERTLLQQLHAARDARLRERTKSIGRNRNGRKLSVVLSA